MTTAAPSLDDPAPPLTKHAGLGTTTLSALVIANMIGAGVFTSSGFSMAALESPGRVMLAWWLCGAWAICGAICYGGLVSRLPFSGGEYLFLSRLVHPAIGFLAGWISVVAGFTAPIAAAAQGAAVYALPSGTSDGMLASHLAAAVIVVSAMCHCVGLTLGSVVQNTIVAAKLLLLIGIIGWAFLFAPADVWQGLPAAASVGVSDDVASNAVSVGWWPEDWAAWVVLVGSMSWIALSYTGFNAAIYVAGEAREPQRTVPRSMLWATVGVTIIYLLLNYVFVYAPPAEAIVGQERVAAIAGQAVGGQLLEWIVRVTIVLAMISSVFAMLLAGPRVYQKMADDGVMPRMFRGEGGSPRLAIMVQAMLSTVVVYAASLLQLLEYLGLTLSACGALAVLSLWWARWKLSDAPRLAWWENVAMLIYLGITFAILWASQATRPPAFRAMWMTFGVGLVIYVVWYAIGRRAEGGSVQKL